MKFELNTTTVLVGSLILSVVAVIALAVFVDDKSVRWEVKYANQLGLDAVKFEADLTNPDVIARVDKDVTEGETRGVDSTPTIFVNGKQMVSYAFESLDTEIAAQLAAKPGTIVLVEEFADFQCPSCKAALPEIEKVKEKYSAEQVNIVFKHFPLKNIHPYAYPAAIASEAAREQGKFEEIHDLLFEHQESLANPRFSSGR